MEIQSTSRNDLRDIFPLLKRRKWLLIIPFVLVLITVGVASQFITPEYESFTIVSIESDVQLSQELRSLLGTPRVIRDPAGRAGELRAIFNQLVSSYYIAQLINKMNLDVDPELTSHAQKLAANSLGMSVEAAKVSYLQDQFIQKIRVSLAAADQIRISAQSTDPVRSRDIANTLASIFIAERQKAELRSVRSSQDFSDVQLRKYETDLQNKIDAKTELEIQLLGIEINDNIASDANRAQISEEIARIDADLQELYNQETSLLASLKQVPDLNLNISRLKITESSELRSSKRDLDRQLEQVGDLMVKYAWSDSDPQIINFRVRQGTLLNAVESEIENIADETFSSHDPAVRQQLASLINVRTQLDYFQNQVTALRGSLDELIQKINMAPELQAQLDRVNRQITSLSQLSRKFKNQLESSSISQALLEEVSSSKYAVIEPAKIPLKPFKPDRVQIVIFGVILGIVLGGAAALLVELLDHSFRKTEDVESFLGMPILGVAPKIEFLKKAIR